MQELLVLRVAPRGALRERGDLGLGHVLSDVRVIFRERFAKAALCPISRKFPFQNAAALAVRDAPARGRRDLLVPAAELPSVVDFERVHADQRLSARAGAASRPARVGAHGEQVFGSALAVLAGELSLVGTGAVEGRPAAHSGAPGRVCGVCGRVLGGEAAEFDGLGELSESDEFGARFAEVGTEFVEYLEFVELIEFLGLSGLLGLSEFL